MEKWLNEKKQVVQKLQHAANETSLLDDEAREFLIRYFQFHNDISNTYIFYPMKIENNNLYFERRRLFDNSGSTEFDLLMKTEIIGMIYFYAQFNKDMSLSPCESLHVNIFLNSVAANISDIHDVQNYDCIDCGNELSLSRLKMICEYYIHH